jgi:SAM-dependent methyltransferase
MFADIWLKEQSISWLDVGAGFGEVVEAISRLACAGSKIEGIEPMEPKAAKARSLGLNVREMYLSQVNDEYDFVSVINVFSHVPDFRAFLNDVKAALILGGEVFIETGDIGKLTHAGQVPSEWDLPDHLVFASEHNLISYLQSSGFEVVKIEKRRVDGFVTFGKNVVKKMIGRHVSLGLPYASPYRTMLVRAIRIN